MDVGSAWYPSRVSELQVWCLRKRRVLMTTFNEKGASDVLNISAVFCQKIVVILSFLFFFLLQWKISFNNYRTTYGSIRKCRFYELILQIFISS